PPAQEALYEPNPYRTSDHDPVVVGLHLTSYDFSGFFRPVDNLPTTNTVKAGQAVPVKFSLNGNQGLDIFAMGYPKIEFVSCTTSAADAIETTVTAGNSSLAYDPSSDQYTYVWKTNKAWSGKCGMLRVRFADGTTQSASFKFK
ncbi:MAG TPA: PxKF domain-containing protein, partial [Ilumatobacteraceae bacterium]